MIEMGNEKIVTGRPKNHQERETQEKDVSGLPSQNHHIHETHTTNVNQNPNETHKKSVKRMVGWSIPPTVKFTSLQLHRFRSIG